MGSHLARSFLAETAGLSLIGENSVLDLSISVRYPVWFFCLVPLLSLPLSQPHTIPFSLVGFFPLLTLLGLNIMPATPLVSLGAIARSARIAPFFWNAVFLRPSHGERLGAPSSRAFLTVPQADPGRRSATGCWPLSNHKAFRESERALTFDRKAPFS